MLAERLRKIRPRLPLLGIGVALVLSAFIAANSYFSISHFEERARWVQHTNRLILLLERVLSAARDTQSASRGYVIAGDERFLVTYYAEKNAALEQFQALKSALSDNPEQLKNLELLKSAAENLFLQLETAIDLRRKQTNISAAMSYVAGGKGLLAMEEMSRRVNEMQAFETTVLSNREREARLSVNQSKQLILFGTAAVVMMIGGAFWLTGREMGRRQKAEQELIMASLVQENHTAQLEATNRELESFSYSISHDLRIPLRAISGYSRMLEEDYGDKLDAEAQRLLGVIRDNSKRMGVLIDDLLAFSRLGRAAMSMAQIDMDTLVSAAVQEVRRKEDYQDAQIEVTPLPPAVGDRALLQQVWINLIANACKYSGKRELSKVQIAGIKQGDEIVYSVTDNGVGFDMQYYNKLFGVFQRLHGADEFPGTGVGLAIVQRVVTRHGGRVWAEGKIDQGASFYFSLPAKDV